MPTYKMKADAIFPIHCDVEANDADDAIVQMYSLSDEDIRYAVCNGVSVSELTNVEIEEDNNGTA